MPPISGSSTLNSMPYMCCGGTVASTDSGRDRRNRSALRIAAMLRAVLAATPRQSFGNVSARQCCRK